MQNEATSPVDRLTLMTGIVGLIIIVLFLVSNVGFGGIDTPAADASAAEVADFFADKSANLEWDVGLRLLVFFLFVPFAAGLARHVKGEDEVCRLMATVTALGAVWVIATGTVANTFEAALVFERDRLASEPELARLLNLGMTGLFTVAVLPHALVIGSASEAGRRSKSLPIWLVTLGYVITVAGVIGGGALTRSLAEGEDVAGAASGIAFGGFALWYLLVSIVLILAGRNAAQSRGA